MPDPSAVPDLVAAVWRQESATIVATLVRMVGDVGLAEELTQEALVAALEQWPDVGVPDQPGAWLTTVARRRAVDHLRRVGRLDPLHDETDGSGAGGAPATPDPDDPDDVLRLVLLTCHPDLAPEERVAMTLRLVAGLGTGEIARAFLVTEQRVVTRIAHAKRTLARIGVDRLDSRDTPARLASAREVVYLVFNEGYTATTGDDLLRPALVDEAVRLGRLLATHAPADPEAQGLLALMELQASRTRARVDAGGVPVALDEQDRTRWDHAAIRRGLAALLRARAVLSGPAGPCVLQAAIAAGHARARSSADTDWPQIAALYDALVDQLPSPVVRVNRAVAHGRAHGPGHGLAMLDGLAHEPALRDYHLLPAVRADLLSRLDRRTEARREWRRAAALTANNAERTVLLRRADALAAAAVAGPTLGGVVARFLARPEFGTATRRSYGQTLFRLLRLLGHDLPVADLGAPGLADVVTATWDHTAPATWNRHRAAVGSLLRWAGRDDVAAALLVALPARVPTPAAPRTTVRAAAWERPGTALRERTLWALLADSAAPVTRVLALDVQDLDLDRARSGPIRWGPATGALLAALVDGRTRGPVFLSDRRPGPARTPDPADRCPDTGRRRLSYERAEYLFKQATDGATLSTLRSQR